MVMTQYVRLTPDMQSKQGALWNRVVRISLLCWLPKSSLEVHQEHSDLILLSFPRILTSVDIKGFHFRNYDDLHNEISYLGKYSLFL